MTNLTAATHDMTRLGNTLEYLDRLIRLEDSGYLCKQEISECIAVLREELSMSPPNEYVLYKGDSFTAEFDGPSDNLHVVGPAKITMKRGSAVE